jgi:mannose/fructose/N-acetylgalactosamine-specific phosphotransferase system component IIB
MRGLFVRIDDRLIHGQVVLGWARVLKPDRVVVANDRVAKSGWEQKLFAASVSPSLKTSFLGVEESASKLRSGTFGDEYVILLFDSIDDVHRAVESGAPFADINVGGLHFREGTRELLPFVYLSENDRKLLKELIGRGLSFTAQDIPGNPAINLKPLVVEGSPTPSAGV